MLQTILTLVGFWDGPIDGVWTDELTQALMDFQTALGVEPTGVVDAATIAAFQQALADLEAGRNADDHRRRRQRRPTAPPTATTAAPAPPRRRRSLVADSDLGQILTAGNGHDRLPVHARRPGCADLHRVRAPRRGRR